MERQTYRNSSPIEKILCWIQIFYFSILIYTSFLFSFFIDVIYLLWRLRIGFWMDVVHKFHRRGNPFLISHQHRRHWCWDHLHWAISSCNFWQCNQSMLYWLISIQLWLHFWNSFSYMVYQFPSSWSIQ